jgi:hypothetical protein
MPRLETGWHPSQMRMGALTIALPKLRQLHTKTAVMARISKLLTKPLPSARLSQSRRVPYLTLHRDCTSTRRVPYLTPHGDCTNARAHSAGTVTQPSPDIPHGPQRSAALTTLQLRGPRMHARRNVSHHRVSHAGDLPAAARALVQGLAAFQHRTRTALTMFC